MVLGVDIGSSATKAVLCDEDLRIVARSERKNRGDPAGALRSVVSELVAGLAGRPLRIGVTGVGRGLLESPPEFFVANDVVALALGAARSYPRTRSVIDIGAQTARWILLEKADDPLAEPEIIDFALNDACAAGSGAFLEQQAARLKLGIEEFAALAAAAKKGANIAGRCSVFAKTDMIHLQQKGTPLEEISYGLCLALARNFTVTVLKGRDLTPPVLLAGGGALNEGLIHAFREVLGLESGSWAVADPPHLLAALGAAAGAALHGHPVQNAGDDGFVRLLKPHQAAPRAMDRALGRLDIRPTREPVPPAEGIIEGFLGVDVGSVSTNLALVGGDGRVLAGVYLPTKGRPLEVLREGFAALRERCPGGFELLGIGTTGSGRHLAGSLLRADVVHNEITCQLRSAVHYVPDVDTIFEIGGQDSKFISLHDGRMEDFTMNKICAAGTGSFLEEQAEILGLRIEDEFSELAAASQSPADLGSRCTVFMESELSDALGRGVPVTDIAAGLAFSIVRNYLEKVVAGRPVGRTVVFQGGVAANPAVVRAFAIELGRDIRVHPHTRISGAIGAALMARDRVRRAGKRSPGGAEILARLAKESRTSSFTCLHCSNRCQVNRIAIEDELLYFGDTCERYTARQGAAAAAAAGEAGTPTLDLFREREDIALGAIKKPARARLRIGLPRASIVHEFLPLWATFFQTLDVEVVLSPESNPALVEAGLKKVPAETCLPIKIVFGHLAWFAGREVDGVFLPSIVDLHGNPRRSVSFCPYTEGVPFMAKAAAGVDLLAPSICLNGTPEDLRRSLGGIATFLGKSEEEVAAAFDAGRAAQEGFEARLRDRGREVLAAAGREGRPVWAIIGRPYSLHDRYLNMNLALHLAKLGVVAVPVDFLPLDGSGADLWPDTPHWRYNRQALEAALWCSERAGVPAVVLTNFGCGLDAFNMRHIQAVIGARPHLVLEFDEHRAEAGLITRLEAFGDELREAPADGKRARPRRMPPRRSASSIEEIRGRRFVLPYFADHVFAFSGALRRVGIEADILPLPDARTVAAGERHASGKECHAYSIIAGDFLKFAHSNRAGGEIFFFPGAKYACVLSQYDKSLNFLADELGIDDLEALAPSTSVLAQILGMKGLRALWQGLVSIDLLVMASCAIRPYEICKGETEGVHQANLKDIEAGLAAGDIGPALKRSAERVKAIARRREKRPLVGIAGDIYTRLNPVANHDLFLRLEELGCEVRPSSFIVDDVDFDLGRTLRRKIAKRRYGESAAAALLYLRKEIEKIRIRKSVERGLPLPKDPTFNDIIRLSSPYVGLDNNHVLILNVAKMAEFAAQGADGVINAICFNCMLGTVAGAIASRIRRDYDNIPIPTFIYTGSELAAEKTRLEAFVYQIKQRRARKSGRREAGGE